MKNKKLLQKICISAILTALFVALDLISIKLGENIKITFGGLPIILAAVYYGPVTGMTVGLLGSFLGQMLSYGFSATTVLWILPAGIRGLLMGILFITFKKSFDIKFLSLEIIISSLAVTVANTVVMYIDSVIYGYYSYAYIFGATAFRLLSSVLTAIVMIIIIVPVTKALNKQNLIK